MKKILCFILAFSAILVYSSSSYLKDNLNNNYDDNHEVVTLQNKQRANAIVGENDGFNSRLFFTDNYVEQELMSEEEKSQYEHLQNIGLAPERDVEPYVSTLSTPNSRETTPIYTDNEHGDGKISKANKVGEYGKIQATLDIKSGWTQFWNGIGERDEDYYRFTLSDQKTMYFNYSGPANYYLRLLRYAKNEEYICTSLGSFSIELIPATYYVHVYTNDKADITEDQYEIYYYGIRNSNLQDLALTEGCKKEYGMAIWENEKYPLNSSRWRSASTTLKYRMEPRRGSDVNNGYVDPLFWEDESKETLTDEVFLDSIVYIWGKDILSELSDKLKEIREGLRKAIYEEKVKEIRAEYEEETINGVKSLVINIIGELTGGITYTILSYTFEVGSIIGAFILSFIADVDYEEAIKDFNIGYWFGSLSQACYDCSILDGVLRLPKYYYLEKKKGVIGNSTLKTTSWKRISTYTPFGVDDHSVFLYQNDSISTYQTISETNKSYFGKITAFKNSQEFKNYIEGVGGGNSLSTHNVHEYSSVYSYDNEYHILVCKCGKEEYVKHSFYYYGTFCECEYCGYIPDLDNNRILSNKYYYAGEYNITPMEQNIVSENGDVILTKRLRCGVINGYLAMSAKSNDADKAYIEYYLNKEAVQFTYDLGLWSDDESLIRNSSIRFEVLINNEWTIKRVFEAKNMSTNKDELLTYTDTLEYPANAFRFVVETNKVNNSNNRGRVVIGNIELTQIV